MIKRRRELVHCRLTPLLQSQPLQLLLLFENECETDRVKAVRLLIEGCSVPWGLLSSTSSSLVFFGDNERMVRRRLRTEGALEGIVI